MREPMLMVLLVSYGFGIVNKDGEPYFDEACVSSDRHGVER